MTTTNGRATTGRKWTWTAVFLPVLLVPLTGCTSPPAGTDAGHGEAADAHGHGDDGGALPMTGEEAVVLHVRAGEPEEFRFTPDALQAPAGARVGVMLHNEGEIGHEFAVQEADFMLHAEGGAVAEGAFIAPVEGGYAFGCYLPGHFEAGMKGAFTSTDGA